MTPNDFYKQLSAAQPCISSVPPLPIKIGKADIMAATLLLWLNEQLPDGATQGDLEDVLDAAKWWSVFFAAAHTAPPA